MSLRAPPQVPVSEQRLIILNMRGSQTTTETSVCTIDVHVVEMQLVSTCPLKLNGKYKKREFNMHLHMKTREVVSAFQI